jgi:hypothetical protein
VRRARAEKGERVRHVRTRITIVRMMAEVDADGDDFICSASMSSPCRRMNEEAYTRVLRGLGEFVSSSVAA